MRKLLFVLVIALPLAAFAGKREREFKKARLMPEVKAAQTAYKKACGCNLKVEINKNLKTKDEMHEALRVATSVKEGVGKYCTDAESKAAVCKMKTLHIKKDSQTGFKFSKGRGIASTHGGYPGFDMMTDQIDK